MKKTSAVIAAFMILCSAAVVLAVDLGSLDKVSVLMPKAEVVSILGPSDETLTLANGLKVEVYHIDSALPLVHSGCIYDKDGILMGQSFVFQGHAADDICGRLKELGFLQIQKEESLRLTGADDDTGQPLVTVIAEGGNLTTITTFEKAFYAAHVK